METVKQVTLVLGDLQISGIKIHRAVKDPVRISKVG